MKIGNIVDKQIRGNKPTFLSSLANGSVTLYCLLLIPIILVCAIFLGMNNMQKADLGGPGFPIDDGYIYSNYVRQAVQGRLFHYVPGEASGGITGLLWYLLLIPVRFCVDQVSNNELARAVWPAYILGVPLLALLSWLVYRWAKRAVRFLNLPHHNLLPALAVAILLANPRMFWAALSGLELPISLVLVVLAAECFLRDALDRGRFGWTLLVVAALPWARPDLGALAALMVVVALAGAIRHKWGWVRPAMMAGLLAASSLTLAIIYLIGYGRPLPSSFYAKSLAIPVAGGEAAQVVASTQGQPASLLLRLAMHNSDSLFGSALALLTLIGIALIFARKSSPRSAILVFGLPAGIILTQLAVISITVHGYSVESRYLLPVWPMVSLLVTGGLGTFLQTLPGVRLRSQSTWPALLAGLMVMLGILLAVNTWFWIQTTYIPAINYSYRNDLLAGQWVREQVPDSAPVAIENAGLVVTVAPTHQVWIDVDGLISPALTDHVADRTYVWNYIRQRRVRYGTVCPTNESWVAAIPGQNYGCLFNWNGEAP